MKKTRSQSTRELTILGLSWLWSNRRCRAVADEIGVSGGASHLTPSSQTIWRADLAGCVRQGNAYQIHVIEVKGSRADLAREDLTEGKWVWLDRSEGLTPWVLVSDDITDRDLETLPSNWGILRGRDGTRVEIVRRAPERFMSMGDNLTRSLYALAFRAVSSRLPFLGTNLPSAVAALSSAPEPQDPAVVVPDPTPLDSVRTYPFACFYPNLAQAGVVGVRGLDGRLIGAALLAPSMGGTTAAGSIDFSSEERLLLETGEAVVEFDVHETQLTVQFRAAEVS